MTDFSTQLPNQSRKIFSVSIERWLHLALLILAAVVFFSEFYAIENFVYKIWGDRDISRSAVLDQYFMVSGSELQAREGTRVPGGALHYITFALLNIDPSPKFVQYSVGTGILLSGLLIGYVAYRVSSGVAASVAVIVFLSSPITLLNISHLWNPAFGVPFAVCGFCMFVLYLVDRRHLYLLLSAICFAISAQMQMAVLVGFLIIVLYILLFKIPVPWRTSGWIFLSVVILYSPWLLNRAFDWFPIPENLPTNAPIYLRSELALFDQEFFLLKFAKKLMMTVRQTFLLSEPNLFRTALPVTAILLGIGALALLKSETVEGVRSPTADKRKIILFLIFFITTTAIFFDAVLSILGGVGFGKSRYYVFLTPAAALITALGFSVFFERALGRQASKFAKVVVIFILSIVLTRALVTVNSNFKRDHLKLGEAPMYNDLLEIAQDIHEKTGYGGRAIKRQTSYLLSIQDKWTARVTPMNYVLEYLNFPQSDKTYGGCLFVVARQAMTGSRHFSRPEARKAVQNFVKNSPIITAVDNGQATGLDFLSARKKYYLFGVKVPFAGCPKSYMNPYIPTPEEIYVRKKFKDVTSNVITEMDRDRFLVRHRVGETKFPIFIMLMLEAKLPDMIVATLHSNQLRNSEALLNGFFKVRGIHQPTLFFLNKDTGRSTEIKLFDGELGRGVFSTPWSRIFKTLPPGTYDLLLKIAGPTPASYQLTKQFVIK